MVRGREVHLFRHVSFSKGERGRFFLDLFPTGLMDSERLEQCSFDKTGTHEYFARPCCGLLFL